MSSEATPRVSAPVLPERWELPGRPEGAPAAVQDAYRQTQFLLGGDLRLLREGMNLQLQIVRDSSHSRYRTHALAAALMPWSRAFLALADAATLTLHGSYSSCPSLVRTACECVAAAAQLSAEELPTFEAWLAGAFRPDETHKAVTIGMGQFFAGSTIAADPRLSVVYRAASELARPHLGAALVLTAVDSSAQRLAVTFADQSFHFGWAQLVLGWLIGVCEAQLRLVGGAGAVFHITEDSTAAVQAWLARAAAVLDDPARCRMEPVSHEGEPRWLLVNVRRHPGAAPRKLLL